ncbi:interleukin-15 receptor subunit alpha isoform X3 [Myripristis murdjan]|uniref:interleukin-15 receptor subunit alpha isoform X3 n=1 Tax=Myripristis murdjan TaxID=586833 RepID=UPI00117621B7|nr:interleukin-15 receptor subunit alpha isoform X3 [Myripristis murdjan]
MDPERLSTLLLTVWLLGAPAGRCAAGDCQCSCSDLPHIPLTEPPPDDCCQKERYRYKCVDGYIRKAGTSNLAKCIESKWEHGLRLVCIPDPNNPPKSTTVEPAVDTSSAALPKSVIETTLDDVSSKSPTTTSPIQTSATSTAASSSNPTARSHNTSSTAPTGQSEVQNMTLSPAPTGSHDNSPLRRQHNVPGLSIMGVLLIGCAAAATGFLCWKRRSQRADKSTQQTETAEEKSPMNTEEDAAPQEVCTPL